MGNGEKSENNVSRWTKWIKFAIAIVTLFVTTGGIIWGMNVTFAKNEYVKERFELAEAETVKTFQQVQKQFEQFGKQQDIKFYQRELNNINMQHIAIEKKLAVQPNHVMLKEERQRIIENKKLIQQKLDKLME